MTATFTTKNATQNSYIQNFTNIMDKKIMFINHSETKFLEINKLVTY
jgi:hypothetical protein